MSLENKEQEVMSTSSEQLEDSGKAYRPDVNIYNDHEKNELIFVVDVPGVKKGNLNIEVTENNQLVLRGKNDFAEPAKLLYKQFNIGNYYRVFNLPKEYDKEKIDTDFTNGTLELRIPKREEYKPRRIEISV